MKLRNFLIPVSIAVQSLSIQAQEAAPDNWFNLDFEQDKVRGVSTEKAYKELLKGKKIHVHYRFYYRLWSRRRTRGFKRGYVGQ
jgi:hypothetical protein